VNELRAGANRRLLTAVFIGLIAIAMVGCGLGESAAGDVHSGPAEPGTDAIQLAMDDEVFKPEVLEVPADTPVTLEITNDGEESHNFTIEGLNVSTGPMEPGAVSTVTFTAPAGQTEFVCTWHGRMTGHLEAN
jgi:plastocyanin